VGTSSARMTSQVRDGVEGGAAVGGAMIFDRIDRINKMSKPKTTDDTDNTDL
jgi:hypothetical protein